MKFISKLISAFFGGWNQSATPIKEDRAHLTALELLPAWELVPFEWSPIGFPDEDLQAVLKLLASPPEGD